ncbi:cytochrome P450 [Lophium mytilinum]|uniref:Cytochrome P450 n=1 Tax=Lophium mytilinum TaxID=390894 RepID=A0A6A6QIR4_9PEZI|nr:cytochrome P450 [Lophium mytilinum]
MAVFALNSSALTPETALISLLVIYFTTVLLYGLYNLTLHPLRSYPGPLLRRAYRLPETLSVLRGTPHTDVLALHLRYGPVVRLAPDQLSYATAPAWKAIYGHYSLPTHGFSELPKDTRQYGKPMHGPYSILVAEKENHDRFRRLLAPGFSEKGMRGVAGRVEGYVDLLIKGLREEGAEKGVWQDLRQWFNWTTFDLIGDLAFGESFGCLELRRHNEWVDAVFGNVKFVPIMRTLSRYGLGGLVKLLPGKLKAAVRANWENSYAKIQRRIPKGDARGDFMDNVLARSNLSSDSKSSSSPTTGMTVPEMVNNASILVLGGSETSATLLTGAVFLLLKHPAVLEKLTTEVRTSFKQDSDITLHSVDTLRYMGAVLDEAMRLYPPVPDSGNRVVPPQGVEICGSWVPGGTSVGVPQYPTNYLPSNFTRPGEFLPERWLGAAEFEGDDRDARQPFSFGARNCIGKNLAYAEMRLILAKVCWNFDMELDEERCGEWMEGQKVFILWQKGPLWVKVKSVTHG